MMAVLFWVPQALNMSDDMRQSFEALR